LILLFSLKNHFVTLPYVKIHYTLAVENQRELGELENQPPYEKPGSNEKPLSTVADQFASF
jgi:hypothetical protein